MGYDFCVLIVCFDLSFQNLKAKLKQISVYKLVQKSNKRLFEHLLGGS